jgi:hypothetical protein
MGASACSAAVGHVPAHRRGERAITLAVGGACPESLGRADDVRNPSTPGRRLLPEGRPTAALVCVYRASPTSTAPTGSAVRLTRTVRLDAIRSDALAASIDHVSLKPASGTFNCPAALGGAAIIALQYPRRASFDLWYAMTGCRTLDNGDALAFEGANPSFYDGFEKKFAGLVGGG